MLAILKHSRYLFREKLGTFVEGLGGRSPGLVFLTAGLSRPFRRLERYGGQRCT